MEYFIPAWHSQLTDWAYSVSHIEIYDAIANMRLLREGKRKVGLVLTDYQPQFMTKLNQVAFCPDQLFVVFDYLQGIHSYESQILDYLDLKWPEDVHFDLTPFHVMASSHGHLYAFITFDYNGRLLNIDYFDEQGKKSKRLIFDTRGFISSAIVGQEQIFYDPMGHWRFKHNRQTDHVLVNPFFTFVAHKEYAHLSDLITEAVKKRFLTHVTARDHLIVTLDDQAAVPLSAYQAYPTIFSLSQTVAYHGQLTQIGHHDLIVDNQQTALRIKSSLPYIVIPAFHAEFKLGHSQRLRQQRVGIFIEQMKKADLQKLIFALYPHLLKYANTEAIIFLYYQREKENEIQEVLTLLKKAHPNEFDINRPPKDKSENQLEQTKDLPNLKIKNHRLSSIADALKVFDQLRILINWDGHDQFIQTAAVSTGIPLLQNFRSLQLINHKNGLICKSSTSMARGVSYYLDNLSNWNQALVFNVQLMNAYSAENLLKQWQIVLSNKKVL